MGQRYEYTHLFSRLADERGLDRSERVRGRPLLAPELLLALVPVDSRLRLVLVGCLSEETLVGAVDTAGSDDSFVSSVVRVSAVLMVPVSMR